MDREIKYTPDVQAENSPQEPCTHSAQAEATQAEPVQAEAAQAQAPQAAAAESPVFEAPASEPANENVSADAEFAPEEPEVEYAHVRASSAPRQEASSQRAPAYDPYTSQYTQTPPPAPKAKKKKAKKQHTGLKVAAVALSCALLGSIGGGTLVAYVMQNAINAPETATEPTQAHEDPVVSNEEFQTMLTSNPSDNAMTPSQIYASYVDSVVGITNETVTNFYGQISSTASSGSGFIITQDGYIVTNYHVIENADTLTVTLHSGESYEAEVVGAESGNDVALLKIDATGLTVAPLGDSDSLAVGDAVVAIGNPLGELDFSLTVGYVSSLDRVINTDGKPINMLQTDTAINPGNSGGALFDLHGNVIGITTAKYSGSTSAGASIEGLGFAIPINDVKAIVSDLQQYGYVVGQPYIGITVGDISSAYLTYYNFPSSAYIDTVVEGSCGDKAGLKEGDIITGVGDYDVVCYTDLVVALKNFSAGDSTTIRIFRDGNDLELHITFDEKTPENTQTQPEEEEPTQPFPFGNLFP